jgi:ferredoxin
LPEVFQDEGDGIATVGPNNEGCFCENVDEIKEIADECPASCIIVEDVDGC